MPIAEILYCQLKKCGPKLIRKPRRKINARLASNIVVGLTKKSTCSLKFRDLLAEDCHWWKPLQACLKVFLLTVKNGSNQLLFPIVYRLKKSKRHPDSITWKTTTVAKVINNKHAAKYIGNHDKGKNAWFSIRFSGEKTKQKRKSSNFTATIFLGITSDSKNTCS